MAAHALLSASSSKRWLTCPPSARLEATIPEPKRGKDSFDFSAEGTLAHEIGELKLRLAYNQIDETEFRLHYDVAAQSKYYTEELENYVDTYVNYVRSQIGDGDRPLFEQRVDFSDWVNDGFGTADVIILSQHKIRVIDLKFGKGIPVDAKDNSQLRLYALGAYAKFRDEFPNLREVEYTIHQPRLDSITTDHTTIDKLVDWANYFVKQKAKKAWSGTGEFVAGDHCQFCRAKSQCRTRSDFVNDLAKMEFRDPPLLDDQEIDTVLTKAKQLTSWVNDVEDYVLNRAIDRNILPPGYKLGTTVTHRKVKDEQMAAIVLQERGFRNDEIYDAPKMKSVSQLEKLRPKGQVAAILGGLIVRPQGTPKLVKHDGGDDFK